MKKLATIGKKHQNVRQLELKERLEDMMRLACLYIQESKADYKKPIPKEQFLANYRITFAVGNYASERYFRDFVTLDFFILNDDKNFLVNAEKRGIIKNRYSVEFPEPKEVISHE